MLLNKSEERDNVKVTEEFAVYFARVLEVGRHARRKLGLKPHSGGAFQRPQRPPQLSLAIPVITSSGRLNLRLHVCAQYHSDLALPSRPQTHQESSNEH